VGRTCSGCSGPHGRRGRGYAGHHLKIWYKNENHISWLDEKPYITSPDGLNVIDPKTGVDIGMDTRP